jgi:glucokinase
MGASIPSRRHAVVVAVDVGGTSIKAGLFDRGGALLATRRAATPARAAPEQIARCILDFVADFRAHEEHPIETIVGVGVALAAFITDAGVVVATPHLSPAWVGYDLRTRLRRDLAVPYYFALDTPAPTWGEAYYGAGRGIDHFVYVTVSTGIGAGVMMNGRYMSGSLGYAGGVGHTIIDEQSDRVCEGCGNAGCVETFAARDGIIRTARDILSDYPHSLMVALCDGRIDRLTPEIAWQAALRGDEAARLVFARAGHALGIALTNLIDIVDPKRVIVGGGIAQAGDLLLAPARAVVQQRAYPPPLREVAVVQAELGDLSGMYGAAAMVIHDLHVCVAEAR